MTRIRISPSKQLPDVGHSSLVVLDVGPRLARPRQTLVELPSDLVRDDADVVEILGVRRDVVVTLTQVVAQTTPQELLEPALRVGRHGGVELPVSRLALNWEWRTARDDTPEELFALFDEAVRRADAVIEAGMAGSGLDAESQHEAASRVRRSACAGSSHSNATTLRPAGIDYSP